MSTTIVSEVKSDVDSAVLMRRTGQAGIDVEDNRSSQVTRRPARQISDPHSRVAWTDHQESRPRPRHEPDCKPL